MKDTDIKKYREECYRLNYPQNSAYWAQGRIDQRFKANDQDLWNDLIGTAKYRSKYQFFFNFIRRQVNMLCGYQRQHRKSTICIPQREGADVDADDMTQVVMHTYNKAKIHEINSTSFEGGVTSGMDWVHIYKDTVSDPLVGDLQADHVGFQNVLVDANFRKQDLSDCGFIWRRRWTSKSGAKMIMPLASAEIDKMRPAGTRDGKFPMQAQAMGRNIEQLLYVDEFYYRDFRKAVMVTNMMTGVTREYKGSLKEAEEQAMFNPWIMVQEVDIPTVKLNISINGHEFYDGENQLGIDRYPFAPYICYYEPDISAYSWRVQGIVRGLRDAQYLYNRRKIIEFDLLESQPNSGWIYKPKHLVNPKDVFKTGQGQGIGLKEQADQTSLQRIEAPSIPQSVVELSRQLSADMMQISGINEELLGAADDDKSGILAQLRQGAGLITLQTIFDRADLTQKLIGEILVESIQKNYTTSKITSILGRPPSPTFFDPDTSRFGIEIEDGIYSTTQRQLALRQAAYFRETLKIPVPDEFFIDKASISDKAEIKQYIAQQQQQAMQQQQMTAQIEMQSAQTENQYKMSQTAEKMASTQLKEAQSIEVESKIEKEEAEADESAANTLKLLQEINNMVNQPYTMEV